MSAIQQNPNPVSGHVVKYIAPSAEWKIIIVFHKRHYIVVLNLLSKLRILRM